MGPSDKFERVALYMMPKLPAPAIHRHLVFWVYCMVQNNVIDSKEIPRPHNVLSVVHVALEQDTYFDVFRCFRLLLAPIFGHAAPGNLGMTSSLLHLPSRATSPPAHPSSSVSPATATTATPSSSPGPSPRVRQSSLMGFLSPAAAAASSASETASKGTEVTNVPGGHSQQFIDESWQQRLHGRPPQQPPPVQPQQPVTKPKQQARPDKPAGAVVKERGVKRPLDFPEDIDALLPPEWGGRAGKPEKKKTQGKQKGKTSLTAQYLHPDTLQHPKHTAMQNRPTRLPTVEVQATSSKISVLPQQQPHTRPSAAAAVAAAHLRAESQQAQHAQHAQQGSNSSIPWFTSNSSSSTVQEGVAGQGPSAIKTAHSFGSWLQPPWGPTQPQAQPAPPSHPPSPGPQQRGPSMPNDSALPLPHRPFSRSEERLGQLTAMHHKAPVESLAGNQTTTSEPPSSHARMGSRSREGAPSRSPSPCLMEDFEFDAELGAISR